MANLTRIKNNQITDSTITNVKIASGTLTGDLMNPQLTFNSNLILNGNLTVAGNFTAVQSQTTQITDPLITLGMGNPGTSYDLGSVLIRGSGGNRFMGWKENAGAFVFINTSEDGTTTGNIPTTSYSNVVVGNLITIGTTTHSDITLSGNTVSSRGGLVLSSGSGTTTLPNAVVMSSTLSVGGATSIGGTVTVNELVSNGAIQGTTLSAFANATVNALTVNASAVVGSTLQAVGGIQNTVIGDTTAAAGYFTTLQAATSLNTGGTATVNALVSNGAIQGTTLNGSGTATFASVVSNGAIQGTAVSASANATVNALTVNNSATVGSTLGVVGNVTAGNINTAGTATVGQIVIQGGIQNTPIGNATPSTGNFTTLGSTGTATFASVVSNGAIQGTAITGSGTGTFASVVSNGAIQGTTIGGSGNATVAGLTVNASAVVGSTLQAVGGIQNTTIGNVTPSPGTFTKLTATGEIIGSTTLNVADAATVNSLNVNNAATIGSTLVVSGATTVNSLTVNNAATVDTTLVTGGTATVNALVSNTSIDGASLSITGNAVVGNLTVHGNLITVNSQTLVVIDPIIELNTGPNGAPLTTDNNFDSGIRTHYYDTADRSAFFGRADDTGFFEYYSNVTSETGNVIVGTYGTIKTGNLQLTGLASVGTTLSVAGNTTVNALSINNSATVGTTLSATGGIQNTVIGNVTAAAGYFTTTNATGNATVNALTVNNSATVGGTLGVTGNAIVGNLSTTNIVATNGEFTNNVTVLGTLTATSNLVANTSGIFFGNIDTGLNAIYAGLPTYTILPNVVAQFTTNVNNYSQLNIQNLSSGTQASGDLVITADNGTDTSNYIDLGIASSTYNYAGYSAYYPNDGYLLIDGGNLLLNVEDPTKAVRFVVGSYDETELVAYIDGTHLEVVKTTSSTNSTDGALVIAGGAGIAGAINGGSTLNVVGSATVNSLVSNGAIQGTAISGSGTGTFASVVSNGAIQGTAISGSGTGTFASVVSNGAIQGTAISGSGNATVAALTVNGSATVGTTLSATAGLQNTPIGNVTASTGAFTTLTASGATTVTNLTDSTGTTTGALVVSGGLGVAKALNVGTTATLGNVTINNTTISSNVTNTGLTINPNGTGSTVINSGLNTSKTVINGTAANTLVVSGTQVGVNAASFISGASFQVKTSDSVLLPVGTQGERPGTPAAGMFRYSTTLGSIEWYNGSDWQTAAVQTTVAVANTQVGNGSATSFTIPVANATTAGTIVSINGVVQEPITAYAVTGNVVQFTEAPSSTDRVDFRVFTTTTQVTSVVDTLGTTGLFLEPTAPADGIILFRTSGNESFSIQANSQSQFTGNVVPTANITYSLGTTTNRWKDLWLSGSTIYLGNVQVKESAGSVAFYAADGSTPAPAAFNSIEHTGTTGTGNIGSSTSSFNTVFAKATSAQYADLAENYLGDAYYEPGTVVEFGGENEVTISTTEMSPRIAGVVSTNPAYLMNSNLEGFATPVALQGRVPCKVTGAVRKGDMMVSAGNGTARSATAPVMGSVIGKALENFDGEYGVIEVVVGRL